MNRISFKITCTKANKYFNKVIFNSVYLHINFIYKIESKMINEFNDINQIYKYTKDI